MKPFLLTMPLSVITLLVLALEPRTYAPRTQGRPEVENRCSRESVKRYGREAVRIGGDIEPPKKLVEVSVEFPELPEGTTAGGMWMGELLVEPNGSVAEVWSTREIRVKPPFPPFNEAILKAMRQWEYEPVTVDGEAMPVCMKVTVNINLS